ncbi:hypothetical protein Hanom_Chr13g01200491 [Helianthus anomalus]
MTGGRKCIYLKISIEPGVENVYTQKFLYENYIYNTTKRKVRGVGRPLPPLLYFAPGPTVRLRGGRGGGGGLGLTCDTCGLYQSTPKIVGCEGGVARRHGMPFGTYLFLFFLILII